MLLETEAALFGRTFNRRPPAFFCAAAAAAAVAPAAVIQESGEGEGAR